MNPEEALMKSINEAAQHRGGRRVLRCADAFALAKRIGVELPAITQICNREGIKIVQCQLGCF